MFGPKITLVARKIAIELKPYKKSKMVKLILKKYALNKHQASKKLLKTSFMTKKYAVKEAELLTRM